MAIEVQTRCSDCGTITERSLTAGDTEIICPECRRNMPNLANDEFRAVSRTLSTQTMLGVVALICMVGAIVMLYFYIGEPKSWVSSDAPKSDTSPFLYGAAGATLVACVCGCLSAMKRYVIEF